ncbi:MAG: FAD-dependent oxidoreductase, partial [Acidobacteria bacterium]|nr:FAD-dependent oxidoreductase [Acidobacteriota bacterium]
MFSAFLLAAQLLDVQAVRALGDPQQWIHTVNVPAQPAEAACDVLVAGAGMGGVAAALRASRLELSVCLTEETDWIGGQATAGGVPALDENRFIERAGGTASYNDFRKRVRAAYGGASNPGNCYVSALCFEPRVGVAVLEEMLGQERVQIYRRTAIFSLDRTSALGYNFDSRQVTRFRFRFVLDATELGDLLPLAGLKYVVGAESKADTGEPDAAPAANPACVQSFTYPFVVEDRPGEKHTIPKPLEYEHNRDARAFTFLLNYPTELGWKGQVQYRMFGEDPPIPNNQSPGPFFRWRRLNLERRLALVNWPGGNDYKDESIVDRSPLDMARALQQAKRLSLGFLYWLQTEAEGKGYPQLRLDPEAMGTADGLSKYPYIRESRRIVGRARIVEQDLTIDFQKGTRARKRPDSIGIGHYMVDIHPCGKGERGKMVMSRPFQIPLGALVPVGSVNLLPAGKSIATTHITNGAHRLHPVEWNIGEAAATLAWFTMKNGVGIQQVAADPVLTRRFQRALLDQGIALEWFDDLPLEHPAFRDIQLAALAGLYPMNERDLHATPEALVTRAEAAQILTRLYRKPEVRDSKVPIDVPADHPAKRAIWTALEQGWMASDHRNWFHPDLPVYWSDLRRVGALGS